tara:strand:+ start:1272 stop:1553 length:282 start_codon:yes stop_codon:yes gene_type:complete
MNNITKKMYCEYRYCDNPNRALPPIKNDHLWSGKSKRRLHKKCWKEFSGDPSELKRNPKNYEQMEDKPPRKKKPVPKTEFIKSNGKPFIIQFS